MRVLALADKPPPMDPALMARKLGVQAIVCLGDLDLAWIDPLRGVSLPKLGVHGNHDPPDLLREVEVEDLHGRRTSLGGRTFAGFEGCVRYGRGGPHHYTQRQATKLAKRLPAADGSRARASCWWTRSNPRGGTGARSAARTRR